MGQYLTIGIATEIAISKDRARREASTATPEKIREALEANYNKSGIYTAEETEDYVYLSLRPEVAEAELLDLLQDFYAMRYRKQSYISSKTKLYFIENKAIFHRKRSYISVKNSIVFDAKWLRFR